MLQEGHGLLVLVLDLRLHFHDWSHVGTGETGLRNVRGCPSVVSVPDTVNPRQRCKILSPRLQGQMRRPSHT